VLLVIIPLLHLADYCSLGAGGYNDGGVGDCYYCLLNSLLVWMSSGFPLQRNPFAEMK